MQTTNTSGLQDWITQLDRRIYAVLIGATLGIIGGLVGLMLAIIGPIFTFAIVFGLVAGLYILTDISAALYAVIGITFLLPFGTFPFKVGLTPTLIDLVLGAFVTVYLVQWMTGRRTLIRTTPIHALIAAYMLWLMLAFALGLRYAAPTPTNLRQFAETLLSIVIVFILVDLLRDPKTLRRLVLVIMLTIGVQAFVAIVLYMLPDALAERNLIRLARIGYPNGGVIRYIEDNPALGERAIGTWVDPNAFGGILAVSAAMIAPQVFAKKPVLRWQLLTYVILGLTIFALFLTSSRASMLAFGIGLFFIAALRYRRFIPVMVLGGVLLLFLPQTQNYIGRFGEAFAGQDLATQMRLGEYRDSINLIQQYPVTGVGFTGVPEIDLYTDVASMYLIMANQIGLVGVMIYLVTIGGVFIYGWHAWQQVRHNVEIDSIFIGYYAALLTAMMNGAADLYFFRLDFQASITVFWLLVALALASARLALSEQDAQELTVVITT